MTDRTWTLADFADEVDLDHPLTERRIPVLRHCHPRFKYHTAIVIGGNEYDHESGNIGLEPTPDEVDQLAVDLESRMRYYNDRYRRIVAERAPFDVDGTVNTHTFRKHPQHGWQYHVMTWTQGPAWFPTPPWQKDGPFTLEALLDRIHTFGDGPPIKSWLELKAEFPERFAS